MNDENLNKLTDIFRTLFNYPDLVLHDGLVAADVPGWDSFNHINLIINIEEEFGIEIPDDEVAEMHTVKSVLNYVTMRTSD